MKFAKVIDTTDGGQVLMTVLENEDGVFEAKLTTVVDGCQYAASYKIKSGHELALDGLVQDGAEKFRQTAINEINGTIEDFPF